MSVDQQPLSPGAKPRVIIVGAGIGGLTLALLLERAGAPYVILEKASSIKPLGSALSLSGTATYLFHQLGLFEEFKETTLLAELVRGYDHDCNFLYTMDFRPGVPMAGANWRIIARPVLYNMLYDRIPKDKIHLNKRVLTIINGDLGARVECSDGSSFDGDVIVGADGAYSPVRQGLFKWLKKNNKLPSCDNVSMPYNCVCLVGQTTVLDPDEFPDIQDSECVFDCMNGTSAPFTWVTFTTKQRTICWMVIQHLDAASIKEHDNFRSSDWGPEAAGAMARAVRDFPIPNSGKPGTTLGHLIDKTDKDLISKVVLEEKIYKTWYGGRTVLLGDACHKLNPAGGSGAMSAIHDALCLANWLNVLPSLSVQDLQKSFREYHRERYPQIMASYQTSAMLSKGLEKNTTGAMIRYVNAHFPKWLWMRLLKKIVAYRPQASFLDHVKDTGTVQPMGQSSLIKTRILYEALLKKQQQKLSSPVPSKVSTLGGSLSHAVAI